MADTPAVRMTLREAYAGLATKVAPLLPDGMEPKQFVGIVGSAMNKWKEQDRAQVDPDSFIFAVREAAELQLWPGTNPAALCYLIPKREKGVLKCQFRLGYRGLEELAYRKGWFLRGRHVNDGDEFDWELGSQPFVNHKPRRAQPATGAAVTHAYSVLTALRTGTLVDLEVIDREEIERRRNMGDAAEQTWWSKNYPVMSAKSAVKAHGMRLPLSPSGQTLQQRGVTVAGFGEPFASPALAEWSEGGDGPPERPQQVEDDEAEHEQNGDGQEPKQGQLV